MKNTSLCWLLLVCVSTCLSLPSGPPISNETLFHQVCEQMWPGGHGPVDDQQMGNGGFLVSTNLTLNSVRSGFNYNAGQNYSVILMSTSMDSFRGFLVQARSVPENVLIGSFLLENSTLQQTLNCDTHNVSSQAAAAHRNIGANHTFRSVLLIWQAPTDSDGVVDILYTIVVKFNIYYIARSTAQEQLIETTPPITESLITPSPTTEGKTTPLPTTESLITTIENQATPLPTTEAQITPFPATESLTTAPTTESLATPLPTDPLTTTIKPLTTLPPSVLSPLRDPEGYRLTFRYPAACNVSDCTVFVGIDNNNSTKEFLDVYIEGQAEAWVAVGFSDTRNMFLADVLACNMNPETGLVEVLDTWNENMRNNVVDYSQDVVPFNSSAANGRITCVFARSIVGNNSIRVEDLDLSRDYYIMYGLRPNSPQASFLGAHDLVAGNPLLTTQRINPSSDIGDIQGEPSDQTRPRLIRAHGILMTIAWPLMAVTAIFFAAWMRPALPNGEWFQFHRFFMLGSIFVAIIGFVLIFVANRNREPYPGLIPLGSGNVVGTVHFSLGIAVMFLHLINPIIAACRCKPDDRRRWLFTVIHGTVVGMTAELLALANVGIGLALFGETFSRFQDLTILMVYFGYLGVSLAIVTVLFFLFTIMACSSKEKDRDRLAPTLIRPLIDTNTNTSSDDIDVGMELTILGTTSDPEITKPKIPSKDSLIRWFALFLFGTSVVGFSVVLIVMVAVDM